MNRTKSLSDCFRRVRRVGMTCGLLLVTLLSAPQTSNVFGERPNVLMVVADDLGFSDLGCYGGEIQTKHLDELASQGVRLTRFYNFGRCCPSRASLLTGQYPHRVGVGHKVSDLGEEHPGYRGRVSADAKSIAEVLAAVGYRSFLSGKWHLGTPDPTQHGFERFYGTLVSAKTYWDPEHLFHLPALKNSPHTEVQSQLDRPFYATDATTDVAIEFLKEARTTPQQPWFLYLAYHAPHFPLQARPADIAKYEGTYQVGWDEIRAQRLTRMKSLGIVPGSTELSARSQYWNYGERESGTNPAWSTLPADRRADLAQRMAIYAAMVDCVDQNVGRIMADLKSNGEIEKTLVIFLSDNGACGEWDPFGFDLSSSNQNILHLESDQQLQSMGGPDTFHSVGSGWANASNTPWRLQKHFNHEGGINSPLIVSWPGSKLQPGTIDDLPAHIIDVLPTVAGAAQVAVGPDSAIGSLSRNNYGNSHSIATLPMPGENLLPLLTNEDPSKRATAQSRPLFFEHEGNRAIHAGDWKLVALRDGPWELYDNRLDRTEQSNLASQRPELVQQLAQQWEDWAAENHVTPFPSRYGVDYLKGHGSSDEDGIPWTYRDRYAALRHSSRRITGGDWQFDDRVASGADMRAETADDKPSPCIEYDLRFDDCEIRFSMKPDQQVNEFLVNFGSKDQRRFGVSFSATSTKVIANPDEDQPLQWLSSEAGIQPENWTDVSITIKNESLKIQSGDFVESVSASTIDGLKTMVQLQSRGGTIQLKNFRLRQLNEDRSIQANNKTEEK